MDSDGNITYQHDTTPVRQVVSEETSAHVRECLEYVVVHELCHLLERGHGPRFHQLMDRFMPDWKQRRDKLR